VLGNNARLGMIYRSLDRMGDEKIAAIKHDAAGFLAGLNAPSQTESLSRDNV